MSKVSRHERMSNQSRLSGEEFFRVGHVENFNEQEVKDLIQFIHKEHYLHYPFNEDGSRNPYQYCYGLGYLCRNESIWAGFVAGIYPNAGFWKEHFPLLVGQKGLAWIFRHAANIYRIVAFYQEDADTLLGAYEKFCYEYKRTSILISLPTKKERDAVCNWDWFSKNGFKDYGWTQGRGARIFGKVLDFEPIEYSPIELARQKAQPENQKT
jgi:hypothetical protein